MAYIVTKPDPESAAPQPPRRAKQRWGVVGFVLGVPLGYAVGAACVNWLLGTDSMGQTHYERASTGMVFAVSVVAALGGGVLLSWKRFFWGGLMLGAGAGLFVLVIFLQIALGMQHG